MTDAQPPRGPCSGFRVVEFATMVSGPLAGQMLGDLGAEVIKVEGLGGDPMRSVPPIHKGRAAFFGLVNRNKKSIVLDLKSPGGLAIARDLALSADVVIENFRPGVMTRLGLGYEALRERNPRLIFASLSGFGQDGPYADRPAYDHVIQAMTGSMRTLGGDGPPLPIRNTVADKSGAIAMMHGVVSALLHRERTGEGQQLSISLLDAFASFMLPDMMVNHSFREEGSQKIPPINMYHPIATLDGHVIAYCHMNSQFQGLCRAIGREDLIEDPRFKDAWSRLSNGDAMWKLIEESTRTMSTAEVVAKAVENGVPMGSVNDMDGFFDDPQVRHNKLWYDMDDGEGSAIRQLSYPVKFSGSPVRLDSLAPDLGGQTDEILASIGYSEADIAKARETVLVG